MSDLQVTKPGLLRPIVTPEELINAQKEVTAFVTRALEQGTDFGVVPGTSKKPTLLKPGAERIQKAFGCVTSYELVEKEIDHDREVHWSKSYRSGKSYGLYRYVIRAIVTTSTGQVVGTGLGSASTLENKYIDRPRDLENTIIKMAQKRAKVAATLEAFGLSDRFTQDVEDIVDNETASHVDRYDQKQSERPDQKVFDGTPDQLTGVERVLKNKKVPEHLWPRVLSDFLGKPGDALLPLINEIMKSNNNQPQVNQ